MLPSHKNGLFYVEHCKIQTADDRLTFNKAESGIEKHVALPHANLLVLMLGPGTSLTQAAARKAAEEGICIVFTAGGGTPLYLASQNEYRPTDLCQRWVKKWMVDEGRLEMAKYSQSLRVSISSEMLNKFFPELSEKTIPLFQHYQDNLQSATSIESLLGYEGKMVKHLYQVVSQHYGVFNFVRNKDNRKGVNSYLTQGNYLAYGISSAVLWVLGIPHAFPLSHGKTRRGALVFDVADFFKDSLILPLAFKAYSEDFDQREYRKQQIKLLDDAKVIKKLFSVIPQIPNQ